MYRYYSHRIVPSKASSNNSAHQSTHLLKTSECKCTWAESLSQSQSFSKNRKKACTAALTTCRPSKPLSSTSLQLDITDEVQDRGEDEDEDEDDDNNKEEDKDEENEDENEEINKHK